MAAYTQSNRVLALTTPLGRDALLLERLSGFEAISELFRFRLQLLAPTPVEFGKVLNQWATVRIQLPDGSGRYINGIIPRLRQGGRVPAGDGRGTFIRYSAELVPALWRLGKRVRSRIFQNRSVPDILKAVLGDDWRLDLSLNLSGRYEARNYCVQYAESDFAFVSRLMEEEGISYYFTHSADEEHAHDKHTLVITDHPVGFGDIRGLESVSYQEERGGLREPAHIWNWEKSQEVPAGLHSLSDYHFQVPGSRLVAQASVADTLDVGRARHPLRFHHAIAEAETLEAFDFPAGYAHRFDDIDGNGEARGNEIAKLHDDSRRVARLRAEEAATWSLVCEGAGSCVAFLPGHGFKLTRHFDGDDRYVLIRVEHEASVEGTYTTGGEDTEPVYENRFQAIPGALPFRPRRVTPKPRVDGLQTATVTGPKGSSISVDLYGRVKVKFHWDRDGAADANSSCWVRVSQPWAGPRYGAFFWPRPGHEVVVGFEHGDPDRPLITGSVYNEENHPPFNPKEAPYMAGLKSASLGADPLNRYNAIAFDDRPNRELVQIHSETGMINTSEATHFQRSSAPSFEVYGRLALPNVSSGSGGGFDPSTFAVVSPVAWSALCNTLSPWKKAEAWSGEEWGKFALGMVYGSHAKTTFMTGGETKGIFFGSRKTHVSCGSDLKYIVDPITLFFSILGAKGAVATGPARLAYKAFTLATDPVSLVAPPVGGSVDLICSTNLKQTYFGPKVDINRCEKYELHAPRLSELPVNGTKEVFAFFALSALTIGRVMFDFLAAHLYEPGSTSESSVPLNIINGGALDRVHGFLALFEQVLAIQQTASKKAVENERNALVAKHETELFETMSAIDDDFQEVPVVTHRLRQIRELLDATRQDVQFAGEAMAGLEESAASKAELGLRPGGNIVHVGDWNVTAQNLTLTSRYEQRGPIPPSAEQSRTTLKLESLGDAANANGVVDVSATNFVNIQGGSAEGASKIVAGKKALRLSCAPSPPNPLSLTQLEITNEFIKLGVGNRSFVRIGSDQIVLKVGKFRLTISGEAKQDCGITFRVNDQVVHLAPDKLDMYAQAMTVFARQFHVSTDKGRVQTNDWDVEPAAPATPPPPV